MYGNQDDAKRTVAAAVKKKTDWGKQARMVQLPQRTYYSLLSIICGNAGEGVARIIEIQ
jgi:hypothetical protein